MRGVAAAWLVVTGLAWTAAAGERVPPLRVPADARVIVFTPHPDDETIAAGGLLARLARRGTALRVVFLTNGDGYPEAVQHALNDGPPSDADYRAFGERRRAEALAALARLGVGRESVRFLGFPDGGLAELWRTHWARPYTSPFTRRARPPYPDSVNPGAIYEGEDLTAEIARELRAFHPTLILMPHPYDTHLDHANTSYFVTEAVTTLEGAGALAPRPRLLSYLVHYPAWPRRLGGARAQVDPGLADTRWLETQLSPAELAAKRRALGEYRTQLRVMRGYLESFLCRNELVATVDTEVLRRIAAVH